jgi:peroxiredoxin/mono/diheme cytochrome c family protein
MPLAIGLLLAAAASPRPVPDFELHDIEGAGRRLSAVAGQRATVVVFLGVDCPMANLYAPRLNELAARFPTGAVAVLAIDPNRGDDLPALAAFAREHHLTFPLLRDPDARVAASFGAARSPQAFLLDAERRVRYRGRIDDQYNPVGKNRGAPTREDLVEALREVLAGRAVSVPVTECTGCLLSKPRHAPEPPSVTYSRDIAPILEANCRACHRPGEVGPFPLMSYVDARNHAETIAEVVANGTMPPWHASPAYGRFQNERRLTAEQMELIAEWVRTKCPEGEPLPPVGLPPAGSWRIGTPDVVFHIPQEFAVPAEGVVEYQHFIVDPGFADGAWVNAIEIRPGNRRVVHHCSVFLRSPNATRLDEFFETGELKSSFLASYVPGTDPVRLPAGMAKHIPPGWKLHFVIHYTPIGTPQTDRTEIAFRLLDPGTVRKEVATKLLLIEDLAIPPHTPEYRAERTWTADRDMLLLSMFPHMHVRGKSFRYTLEYPDGTSEIILDVPHYDFNWQHLYTLAEPKRIPAGTVVRCTAVYDNSANNPFNPDPSATVRTGIQTWEEMFNGVFDIALADQDLVAERAAVEKKRERSQWVFAGAVGLAGLWGVHIRRKRRRSE